MTIAMKCRIVILALLCVASPAYASSCAPVIAVIQAKVDSAIERSASADGWKREGLDAKLGRQPTPFSVAGTEGKRGINLQVALDSLDRAREADRVGDVAVCRRELETVRSILRHYRQK